MGQWDRGRFPVPCPIPGVVIADLRSHRAASVVDILRAGAAGLRRDALQTVGVAGHLAALVLGNDHAVPVQNIPRQCGCQIFAGLRRKKSARQGAVARTFALVRPASARSKG